MKREPRIDRTLSWHMWVPPGKWPPPVARPGSVLRCKAAELCAHGTASFRVGYYSRQDGPNCVWLVRPDGKYCETWDQTSLLDHFDRISESSETDFFGATRPALEPVA